jgi:hypothetical protein
MEQETSTPRPYKDKIGLITRLIQLVRMENVNFKAFLKF